MRECSFSNENPQVTCRFMSEFTACAVESAAVVGGCNTASAASGVGTRRTGYTDSGNGMMGEQIQSVRHGDLAHIFMCRVALAGCFVL